jgi:hypothetical protein
MIAVAVVATMIAAAAVVVVVDTMIAAVVAMIMEVVVEVVVDTAMIVREEVGVNSVEEGGVTEDEVVVVDEAVVVDADLISLESNRVSPILFWPMSVRHFSSISTRYIAWMLMEMQSTVVIAASSSLIQDFGMFCLSKCPKNKNTT